jgi:hypothetical protein
MLEVHDHAAVRRPRGDAQLGRHGADHERVVPDGEEVLREAGEQPGPVVADRAEAPVHDLGRVLDRAAYGVRELLVAEAHTEDRHVGAPQHLERHPGVARCSGRPGAGEITTLSNSSPPSSSHNSSSLRMTTGSSSLISPSR